VEITGLHEGTYFAEVHLRLASGVVSVMDSRPSDAIAMALRMKAPIFASREVLGEAGYVRPEEADSPDTEGRAESAAAPPSVGGHDSSAGGAPGSSSSSRTAQESVVADNAVALRQRLEQAVSLEEYELAARLRDEIRRLESQSGTCG